eukprot:12029750-Ditylum_brightwellii.AAC.1
MLLSQTKEGANNIINGIQDIKTKSTSGITEDTVSAVTDAVSKAEFQNLTDGESKILTLENEEDLLTQEQTNDPGVKTGNDDEESISKSSDDDDESNNDSNKEEKSTSKESKHTTSGTIQKKVMSTAMVTWKQCLLQQHRFGCSPRDIDPGDSEVHQE